MENNRVREFAMAEPAGEQLGAFVEQQLHALVEGALHVGVSMGRLSQIMGRAVRSQMPFKVATGYGTSDEGLESLLGAEGGCVEVEQARMLFRKPGGVTRQALAAQIRNGNVLACRSGGGGYAVPVWQFRPEGGVVAGLPETLAAVSEKLGAEPLTAFAFLLQAHPLTGGRTPLEALKAGQLAAVLAAVDADAR